MASAEVVHEYKAHMVWPARTSVTVEVCKGFAAGQAVPGFEQTLLGQMQGWVPQLPVAPTATLEQVADAALRLAQQIGGSTVWVHVSEGSTSVVQRIVRS